MSKYIGPVSIGLAVGAIGSFVLVDSINEISAPITSLGEWFRLLITTISLLVAAYMGIKGQQDKQLQRTIDIQKQELAVIDGQNKRFKEELHTKDMACAELQRKFDVLTVKTDLSQVLEALAEHAKIGEQRYVEAMDVMVKMLTSINTQTEANHKALNDLMRVVDKRWKVKE